MSNVMMTKDRMIPLPAEVCEKHGFRPETPIRIVETQSGVLLAPLTGEPMSPELLQELADWQSLSSSAWEQFPYEECP